MFFMRHKRPLRRTSSSSASSLENPLSASSTDLLAVAELKSLHQSSTHQWNSALKSRFDSGRPEIALSLFCAMRQAGAPPDHYTLPLVNRAISSVPGRIHLGEAVHCLAIRLGFAGDVYFGNTLMEVYARNGGVGLARRLFDEMPVRDVVSWTSLISAFAHVEDFPQALDLLRRMRVECSAPSPVTMAVLLRASCIAQDLGGGYQLFGFAIKIGFGAHELVQNSVLTMLSKLACFEEVKKLFGSICKRSVASWNIIISFYSSVGDSFGAVDCYVRMRMEFSPSHETLTLLISAFAKCEDLRQGRKVHGDAIKTGQIDAVLHAVLVDFYAKCGELGSAIMLYEEAEVKSCTIWSIMMWGFIRNGDFLEAVNWFQRMQNAGLEPSKDALRALVLAYSELGALVLGRATHGYLLRNTLEANNIDDSPLQTSILNMYSKCGSIVLARRCFDQIVVKDVVAWTSMIEGYAIHGLGSEALELFYQMLEEGVRPNSVTFLSLLSAQSHSGLLKEGCKLFNCMTKEFGINPDLSHYTCLVDLLGRSGKLHEALGVIENMSVVPDGRIWGALLASCRQYSDGIIGSYAAKKLFDLEPGNVGYQVLLSNIFASDEMWEETENSRKSVGKKKPAWSSIQENGGSSMFVAGDRSHLQVGKIYKILEYLRRHSEEL